MLGPALEGRHRGGNWGPNPIDVGGPLKEVAMTGAGGCAVLVSGQTRCWGEHPLTSRGTDPVPYDVPELKGATRLVTCIDDGAPCAITPHAATPR